MLCIQRKDWDDLDIVDQVDLLADFIQRSRRTMEEEWNSFVGLRGK